MTILQFSTDSFPEKDRLESAQEHYSSVADINILPQANSPFFAHARFNILPDASIIALKRSPMRIQRTRAQAARGDDNIALFINTGGQYRIDLEGAGPVTYSIGEAYLAPSDCAGTADISHTGIDIVMARASLKQAIPDIDRQLKQRIPNTPALRLLTRYAHSLSMEEAMLPNAVSNLATNHLRDLITHVLGTSSDTRKLAEKGGVRAARLKEIKSFIDQHLDNAALNSALVAKKHGISDRYLRALFADENSCFSDYVLEQRLNRACNWLSSTQYAHLPISMIALDCGFEDLSWFNRTFKRKFQKTPTEVRMASVESLKLG